MRLLWIDDEPSVPESSRRSLGAHGIDLSVALTGPNGVAMAIAQSPDAIILDLRLGDAWGLDVMRELRSAGVTSPVMVLTAYAESDSAFKAGQLGVAGFHSKPLVGQDLVNAIRRTAGLTVPRVDLSVDTRTLIQSACAATCHRDVEQAVRRCARALSEPNLGFCQFLAISRCVRLMRRQLLGQYPLSLEVEGRNLATLATLHFEGLDERIRGAEAMITKCDDQWPGLRASSVAEAVGADERTLSRLLQRSLALSFRELVRTIVMRRAVNALACPDEHVRQIGFRLGYEHHTSFDQYSDSAAIQACLNGGGTIVLELGSPGYIIDEGLVMTQNGTVLTATGDKAVLIAHPDLDDTMLIVDFYVDNFEISELIFDGNKGNRNVGLCDDGNRGLDTTNVRVSGGGSGFALHHIDSINALCGSAMEVNGSDFDIYSNYLANNGFEEGEGYDVYEQWADGLTITG